MKDIYAPYTRIGLSQRDAQRIADSVYRNALTPIKDDLHLEDSLNTLRELGNHGLSRIRNGASSTVNSCFPLEDPSLTTVGFNAVRFMTGLRQASIDYNNRFRTQPLLPTDGKIISFVDDRRVHVPTAYSFAPHQNGTGPKGLEFLTISRLPGMPNLIGITDYPTIYSALNNAGIANPREIASLFVREP